MNIQELNKKRYDVADTQVGPGEETTVNVSDKKEDETECKV